MKKSLESDYLYNIPKIIVWKRIVGPELDYCQMHDVVFDQYDYKIRQLSFQQIQKGNQI